MPGRSMGALRGPAPAPAPAQSLLQSPAASPYQVSTIPRRNRPAKEQWIRFPPSSGRHPAPSRFDRPMLSRTCCAVVGESSVKRFALGAAMGTPASRIRCQRDRLAGMRMPTVVHSGGQPIRNMRLFGQYQRQRPGPKFTCQVFSSLRPFAHQAARHFDRISREQSEDWSAAGPLPRRFYRSPRDPGHWPRARTPSRWETPPARLRGSARLPWLSSGGFTQAGPLFRRPRFCRCACRPGTRASDDPGRHPKRDPRRRSKAWCDDPSPCDTAPARSCGSGCRN